jgi:hypothetical protein
MAIEHSLSAYFSAVCLSWYPQVLPETSVDGDTASAPQIPGAWARPADVVWSQPT